MTANTEVVEQEIMDLRRMLFGACQHLVSNGIELGPQQKIFYNFRLTELRNADKAVWDQLTEANQAAVTRYLKSTEGSSTSDGS